MARILVAATPLYGHVRPLTRVAEALRAAGQDVTMLVGTAVSRPTRPTMPPTMQRRPADSMDRVQPSPRAGARRRPRWVRGRDEVLNTFVIPMEAQADALSALAQSNSRNWRFDAIVADVSFLGVQPLLSSPSGTRPPVIGVSVTPIMLPSQDCAPFGAALPPWPGPVGGMRNRQTDWLLRNGPMRKVQRAIDISAARMDVGPREISLFGAIARFDHAFHLGLPELEYPRRELPSFVEFVGPLPETCTCRGHHHPIVDARKHIVHVTQGTLDNADLRRLVLPTVRALGGGSVTVIASTGGTDPGPVRLVADQDVHIVDFACYHWLLPRISLMITNGGYGGVQQAARHGVPLIVAGDTQDKAEVAARVRWSGIGVDLHTGRPRSQQIAAAAARVLADHRYARRAAELAASADRLGDPTDRIVGGILAAVHPKPHEHPEPGGERTFTAAPSIKDTDERPR